MLEQLVLLRVCNITWINFSSPFCLQYLGSTHVKELKGTESTMKSIQKLKKTPSDGTKVPKIILSVSYKGVKFMDYNTQVRQCFLLLFCDYENYGSFVMGL